VVWYAIPVGVGIGVVALVHLGNAHSRLQKQKQQHQEPAIRPMNSWQVQVLSTLPLKAISYYWGKFNEIPLPRFLRVPGFKLYAYIFGVNLDEVEKDLTEYRNLSEFFYRRLKEGVRKIDERSEVVVSPADGVVLQVG
jgi:phosphatidylserine decarboxylase